MLTDTQVSHFHTHGFILIKNPFGEKCMQQIDQANNSNQGKNSWSNDFNKLACQFLSVGELVLEMVEQPKLIEMAKQLLDCDRVHIGACGFGDALKIVSQDGRSFQQVDWHSDGGPEVKQVSFRTALDCHHPGNAPLRILPGSHLRLKTEVWEELIQLEITSGQHQDIPSISFVKHPAEVKIVLDPRWTLVWTPSCWHATGIKTTTGLRRAIGWNYVPLGSRKRDTGAVKYIFGTQWESWSLQRQKLWGLLD